MNISDLPGISWLMRRPLLLIALLLAALGVVAVELLPSTTPNRKAIANQAEWRVSQGGECHPGSWKIRITTDSITVEHDGEPGKTVAAKVTRPDAFAISAAVREEVGFGPEIRLITIAQLPGGRARLYLCQSAANTRCVHDLTVH